MKKGERVATVLTVLEKMKGEVGQIPPMKRMAMLNGGTCRSDKRPAKK